MNGHKNSEKFCLAPFRGFYQGYDGNISVCCQTPVLVEDKSYDEAIHDDKIKNLRKKFLDGQYPDECKYCTERVRNDANEICSNIDDDLLPLSIDYHIPVFMDLLWSNKCNFACMGCKPIISTGMKKYESACNIADPFDHSGMKTNWDTSSSQEKRIDYIVKNSDTIKLIHLNGGEPLMQNGFYELLERLIKKNATHISIWTHTNGSISSYKGRYIIELLKAFKNPTIIMSHDGIGKKGEYIRWGLKQDTWLKNYKKFTESGILTQVQVCYNVFNCLDLGNMAKWYKKNLSVIPKLSLWNWPPCYSAKFLQINTKLYKKAISTLEEFGPNFRQHEYVLRFMREKHTEKELQDMQWRFCESVAQFDKLRGTDFLETFPELEDIYY